MPPSLPIQASSNGGGAAIKRTRKTVKKKVVPRNSTTTQVTKKKRQATTTKPQDNDDHHRQDGSDGFGTGPLTGETTSDVLLASQNNNTALQGQMALGMYGSPMYGGYGGMPPMMPGSPFSGLYQVLFGVQNVVFSLGQAVQILGTNQQAIQQAFDSLVSMFDHAVATFHELRALEAVQIKNESEEQKNRRRRLKAIRWAILMGGSWLMYKLVHRIIRGRRRRLTGYAAQTSSAVDYPRTGYGYSNGGMGAMYGSNLYGGYPPGGASMFGGGGGLFGPGGSYY